MALTKTRPSTNHGRAARLQKVPTGITGLEAITSGGLPAGRITLVCGGPGCGKTLLASQFLMRGAMEYDEPGVFVSFEETERELSENLRSLGIDAKGLMRAGKIVIDHVHIERSEIEETGIYDLEGLFIRIGLAIDSIGAKRVVLDTIETLFATLDPGLLRSELRRLFRWLKDRGVTVVVTGEQGEGSLTREGLEEYISDCVIVLDHRIEDSVSTRRLRVMKYRGGTHGTNEYPFVIDERGINIIPITSLTLDHPASTERISSGIPRLDTMLDNEGFFRGSSVLVSGSAGTGKSSLLAHFANATCDRGNKVLYLALEESANQIARNMRSIGIDLRRWMDDGLLRLDAYRPTRSGLETHLMSIEQVVESFGPDVVIVDPITNLSPDAGHDVRMMLLKLVDTLKSRGITSMYSALTTPDVEESSVGVSSLMDTWILLRNIEANAERNRLMFILKSRGMSHSNQVREFFLTDRGIELADVYIGPEGVLTGSARAAQAALADSVVADRLSELESRKRAVEQQRKASEAEIMAIRARVDFEEESLARDMEQALTRSLQVSLERSAMAALRHADLDTPGAKPSNGSARKKSP